LEIVFVGDRVLCSPTSEDGRMSRVERRQVVGRDDGDEVVIGDVPAKRGGRGRIEAAKVDVRFLIGEKCRGGKGA